MTWKIEDAMTRTEAILRGHFKLTSGNHSEVYFQCARLLAIPEEAEHAGAALAEKFRGEGIESVIAPAIGGITFSFVVAQALRVPSYFAEREADGFALRRGFRLRDGERVLVVEDVLTTGGSAMQVADLVARLGAGVAGIGSLVNRGGFQAPGGIPTRALWDLRAPLFTPEACPLCAKGLPVVKPGSRPETR